MIVRRDDKGTGMMNGSTDDEISELITDPPRYLYRYHSLDGDRTGWARDLIADSNLYFSSPHSFNDPFDCLPTARLPVTRVARELAMKRGFRRAKNKNPDVSPRRLRDLMRAAPERAAGELASAFRMSIADVGMVCFSEVPDDVLMWSHYADCHRGICIRFDTSKWPIRDRPMLFKVKYQPERPCVAPIGSEARFAGIIKAVACKADFWEREKEWRLVEWAMASHKRPFSPDIIDGVILGCRINGDDEARVRQWAGSSPFARRILRAEINAHDFRLDIAAA
jgi:hypothetical protein